MILRKAEPADVAVLTGISDSALRADATAAQRREELYEGFDSEIWYEKMRACGALYALSDGIRSVGGAVAFFDSRKLYIERFFVLTAPQRRTLLEALEKRFPDAERIELEAPEENKCLLGMLEQCGYTPIRGNGDWIFCLKMPHGPIPATEFLQLTKFDGMRVRVTTHDGEVFEGECSYNSEGYNDAEFGVPEDGLQMEDVIVGRSDILRVEVLTD